jgi:glucose/mannose-6-phosphate isomerase
LSDTLVVLAHPLQGRQGQVLVDEAEIDSAVATGRAMAAKCLPEVPTADNPAKQLAWSMVDRLAIVTASGFMAPVARRWKAQLNENSKAMAVFEALP